MAEWYVDDAGDGDPGYGPTDRTDPTLADNWTNAFADLDVAFDAAGAGDIIYVADDTVSVYGATITYTSAGTVGAPVTVYSVNKATGAYSPGAIEDADGSVYEVNTAGYANLYGVTIKIGAYFRSGANCGWTFTDCSIENNYNNSASYMGNLTQAGWVWIFINSNITFLHTGAGINFGYACVFEWLGGSLLIADLDQLVERNDSFGGICRIRGVDLSIMSGGALFNGLGGTGDESGFYASVIGCKLNATPPVLVTDTLPAVAGIYLEMIDCGSASIPQTHIHTSQGDITQETTVVRTATYDGTNGYSYKMITNANSDFHTPLRFKLAEMWMAANPTITVECTHDAQGTEAGGNFGDDEWWIEIEYPVASNAAFKKWDRTSRMATLGTSAIRAAGTSGDWTSGKTDFDKCVETISGGAAGVHKVWVCLAPPAKTVYVCPKLDVS